MSYYVSGNRGDEGLSGNVEMNRPPALVPLTPKELYDALPAFDPALDPQIGDWVLVGPMRRHILLDPLVALWEDRPAPSTNKTDTSGAGEFSFDPGKAGAGGEHATNTPPRRYSLREFYLGCPPASATEVSATADTCDTAACMGRAAPSAEKNGETPDGGGGPVLAAPEFESATETHPTHTAGITWMEVRTEEEDAVETLTGGDGVVCVEEEGVAVEPVEKLVTPLIRSLRRPLNSSIHHTSPSPPPPAPESEEEEEEDRVPFPFVRPPPSPAPLFSTLVVPPPLQQQQQQVEKVVEEHPIPAIAVSPPPSSGSMTSAPSGTRTRKRRKRKRGSDADNEEQGVRCSPPHKQRAGESSHADHPAPLQHGQEGLGRGLKHGKQKTRATPREDDVADWPVSRVLSATACLAPLSLMRVALCKRRRRCSSSSSGGGFGGSGGTSRQSDALYLHVRLGLLTNTPPIEFGGRPARAAPTERRRGAAPVPAGGGSDSGGLERERAWEEEGRTGVVALLAPAVPGGAMLRVLLRMDLLHAMASRVETTLLAAAAGGSRGVDLLAALFGSATERLSIDSDTASLLQRAVVPFPPPPPPPLALVDGGERKMSAGIHGIQPLPPQQPRRSQGGGRGRVAHPVEADQNAALPMADWRGEAEQRAMVQWAAWVRAQRKRWAFELDQHRRYTAAASSRKGGPRPPAAATEVAQAHKGAEVCDGETAHHGASQDGSTCARPPEAHDPSLPAQRRRRRPLHHLKHKHTPPTATATPTEDNHPEAGAEEGSPAATTPIFRTGEGVLPCSPPPTWYFGGRAVAVGAGVERREDDPHPLPCHSIERGVSGWRGSPAASLPLGASQRHIQVLSFRPSSPSPPLPSFLVFFTSQGQKTISSHLFGFPLSFSLFGPVGSASTCSLQCDVFSPAGVEAAAGAGGRGRGRAGSASTAHISRTNLSMLDIYVQLQLGITVAPSVQRGFLLQNCQAELERRGLDRGKVLALDNKLLQQLVKEIALHSYLSSVPFRVFGFDLEFTGPPVFRAEGPTEDIIQLGLYAPGRDQILSCLVKPVRKLPIHEEVEKLTGITNARLRQEAVPFPTAWKQFMAFLETPDTPDEDPRAGEHILLLSHGGKLADQSLIKFTLEHCGMQMPEKVLLGDTLHIIRDAHRRRPVTVDRHPPSWGLSDLVAWLNIPPTLPAHQAGNDAKMTYDVLYHTLLRYGDEALTPKQQLVSRFFDEEAKRFLRDVKGGADDALSLGGGGETEEEGVWAPDADAGPGAEGSQTLTREASEALLMETDFDAILGGADLVPPSPEDGDEAGADGTVGMKKKKQHKECVFIIILSHCWRFGSFSSLFLCRSALWLPLPPPPPYFQILFTNMSSTAISL
eukprot:gene13458-9266_t